MTSTISLLYTFIRFSPLGYDYYHYHYHWGLRFVASHPKSIDQPGESSGPAGRGPSQFQPSVATEQLGNHRIWTHSSGHNGWSRWYTWSVMKSGSQDKNWTTRNGGTVYWYMLICGGVTKLTWVTSKMTGWHTGARVLSHSVLDPNKVEKDGILHLWLSKPGKTPTPDVFMLLQIFHIPWCDASTNMSPSVYCYCIVIHILTFHF